MTAPVLVPASCRACVADGHRHRAVRVGPFLICRCLSCPVLVIPEVRR